MAEVFLACPAGDPSKQLVIKRILPHLAEDAHFVTMFLNEARIAAQLSHPNIVTLFDLGKEGSSFFLAMEYIYGEDVGALIQSLSERGVLLPIPLAVRIISDACEGLAYAHAKRDLQGRPLQLIHRDISPQNLMVGFDGAVKLLDFGIARAANQSSTTQTGEIKGKYSYIAPEQARGADLDLRCDIFSLGLVLYELLTGISPNKRDNELFTLRAALEGEIQPPGRYADLPSGLEQVVMRAAAREKDDRFASAAEFRQALQPFLGNASEPAMRSLLALTMQTLFYDRLRKEAASGGRTGSFTALPAKTPAAMERELRLDL